VETIIKNIKKLKVNNLGSKKLNGENKTVQ
jgi:hypothetical protein